MIAAVKRTACSARFWLAGPAAFVLAIVLMLGMGVWFPKGAGQINNIIFPLVVFPLLWAVVFFFAYLQPSNKRVAWTFLGVFALHLGLLLVNFI